MKQGQISSSELQRRLNRLSGLLVKGAMSVSRLRRLSGGASLETWAFHIEGEDVCSEFILRRRGEGDRPVFEVSLPLAVEARLLSAAAGSGVKVAEVLHLCTEEDAVGEAYIMRRVSGETLGRKIAASPDFAPARDVLAFQCGQSLARIHAISASEIEALPSMDAKEWLEVYHSLWLETRASRPVLDMAFGWLAKSPPESRSTLVHGDFRNGNLIVDKQLGLQAVLDWELAHLGDPAEDFGWLTLNSWRFGEVGKTVGGFGTLADLFDGYKAGGGTPPDEQNIRWWQVAGTLKWAIIADMMYQTSATLGNTSVERPLIGRRVSECEVDLLTLLEDA